jgi:Ca-activated chloride channel family protein
MKSRQADENQTGDATEDPANSKQADNATSEQEQPDNNADAQQQAQQGDGDQENVSEDQPMAADQQAESEAPTEETATTDAQADTASYEQQQADERWLRRIPDDPGGLLRRKFLYQYSQRGEQQKDAARQAW